MGSEQPHERVVAEFLSLEHISEEEVCLRVGIGRDILQDCLQWEVIAQPIVNEEGFHLYPSDVVHRLKRGLRIHRDLGVNWVGVGIILDLMDRLEELERRVQELVEEPNG